MKRLEDEVAEQVYGTRFADGLPEHITVAAHKIMHPLVAAESLQDVGVLGQIVKWANNPGRLGIVVNGKWHVTFTWCEDSNGAFGIKLERR